VACQQQFDDVALHDLAHSLRILTEMNAVLDSAAPQPSFYQSRMSKQWKRAIGDAAFILAPGLRMIDIEGLRGGAPGIIWKALSPDDARRTTSPNHVWPTKKLVFSDWMAAEVLFWRARAGEDMKSFTRERLIKRIANFLGASHAFDPNSPDRKPEDELLLWLVSSFSSSNRPFPYFLLMLIAHEILEAYGYVPQTNVEKG
jgi:hypothetical protein